MASEDVKSEALATSRAENKAGHSLLQPVMGLVSVISRNKYYGAVDRIIVGGGAAGGFSGRWKDDARALTRWQHFST